MSTRPPRRVPNPSTHARAAKANVAIFWLDRLHTERSHRHMANAQLVNFIGCDRTVTACFFGSRRCTRMSAHFNVFEWVTRFIRHGTAVCAAGLREVIRFSKGEVSVPDDPPLNITSVIFLSCPLQLWLWHPGICVPIDPNEFTNLDCLGETC